MSGSCLSLSKNPDWSGYMELVTKGITDYQTSKVIRSPFSNLLPPRAWTQFILPLHMQSINTKVTTCRHASSHLISHCAKVVNMVACSVSNGELSSVVVRLDEKSENISETENFKDRKPLKRNIHFITFRVGTVWLELQYIVLYVYCELMK